MLLLSVAPETAKTQTFWCYRPRVSNLQPMDHIWCTEPLNPACKHGALAAFSGRGFCWGHSPYAATGISNGGIWVLVPALLRLIWLGHFGLQPKSLPSSATWPTMDKCYMCSRKYTLLVLQEASVETLKQFIMRKTWWNSKNNVLLLNNNVSPVKLFLYQM